MVNKVNVFWFRRDLRLEDNIGLWNSLNQNYPTLLLFIFDDDILSKLNDVADARVNFIHQELEKINQKVKSYGSSILIKKGKPLEVWKSLLLEFSISEVYCNKDYEPYARDRDVKIKNLLSENQITFNAFKDQVILEENEVLKDDGLPYTVFTPYKNKWLQRFLPKHAQNFPSEMLLSKLSKNSFEFPSLRLIGFQKSNISVLEYNLSDEIVNEYHHNRDFPSKNGTSQLGVHLRFGTVSVREIVREIQSKNPIFLSEIIWREFFKQILYHFPHVVQGSFKKKYDKIIWENNELYFKKWCEGNTGYPMVDAGMRELNQTGYMHNRVRMVVASFLIKHLLIDWRWGEAYFAEKLLDFDLSANNGNWQWAAGCGCDAAPYFRVFNPYEQHRKFDVNSVYIQKWVPEYQELTYSKPIVNHPEARLKAIALYKSALEGNV